MEAVSDVVNRSAELETTSGGEFVHKNAGNWFGLWNSKGYKYLKVKQQPSTTGVDHYLLSSQYSLIFVALRRNLEYLLNISTFFCSVSLPALTATGAFQGKSRTVANGKTVAPAGEGRSCIAKSWAKFELACWPARLVGFVCWDSANNSPLPPKYNHLVCKGVSSRVEYCMQMFLLFRMACVPPTD